MGRATTKNDLIKTASEKYDKLWEIVDGISEDKQLAAFCYDPDKMGDEAHWKRDKNLRDVFVHLYEWHELLLNWVESNQNGVAAAFLPPPYNWKTYGQMNIGFWEKHKSTPYDDSKRLFCDSHKRVMAIIKTFSNEELFERGRFSWTGASTLGAYCVSATASHYDWAMKKIKANIKACKA